MSTVKTTPARSTPAGTPEQILRRFIRTGRLDERCQLEVTGPSEVTIVVLRAADSRHGAGRAFLRALKQAGWRVHVRHPTREALPFWRRMRADRLLDEDPDALRTWEEFLDPIESQMKVPDLFDEDDPTEPAPR